MPDSRPIGLVAWEDATKKPPEDDMRRWVVARVKDGSVRRVRAFDVAGEPFWYVEWCEFPTPPGPDALTVADLWRLYRLAQEDEAAAVFQSERFKAQFLVARLRKALDALGNGNRGTDHA